MDIAHAIYEVSRDHTFLFIGCIVSSTVAAAVAMVYWQPDGKWFALMTSVWIAIHGVIAGMLLNHIHVPPVYQLDFVYHHIVCWVGVNIGLDFLYLLIAIYFIRRSRFLTTIRCLMHGFGVAILAQSITLTGLDTVFLIRMVLID